jgi:hypothetical protein
MTQLIERALRLWCQYFHNDIYAPVGGQYLCRSCHRQWPVPWEGAGGSQAQVHEGSHHRGTNVVPIEAA